MAVSLHRAATAPGARRVHVLQIYQCVCARPAPPRLPRQPHQSAPKCTPHSQPTAYSPPSLPGVPQGQSGFASRGG